MIAAYAREPTPAIVYESTTSSGVSTSTVFDRRAGARAVMCGKLGRCAHAGKRPSFCPYRPWILAAVLNPDTAAARAR